MLRILMFSPIVHGNLNIRENRRYDEISLLDLRKSHMIWNCDFYKMVYIKGLLLIEIIVLQNSSPSQIIQYISDFVYFLILPIRSQFSGNPILSSISLCIGCFLKHTFKS